MGKGFSAAFLALFVLIVGSGESGAQPGPITPPSNLEVDPVFQPAVARLWQASPTFRGQCSRLAAERSARVRVLREDQPRRAAAADARTAFTFEAGILVSAYIFLRPSPDAARLIAHEMEHVLEQLDGVDLHAQAGNGDVWSTGQNAFETTRAIERDRRVVRELTMGADASHARGAAAGGELRVTRSQRDRDASPLTARSARVSAGGRYVVFISMAPLVERDGNKLGDVYVLDLKTGQSTLESIAADGNAANGGSRSTDISGDGRYVVFESEAGNLTKPEIESGTPRIFLRDRHTGTTVLLSVAPSGERAQGPSRNPVISEDGTTVAFESAGIDLSGAGAARLSPGIYLVRIASGIRARVDVTTGGKRSAASMSPAITADGRFVAFASKADLTCGNAPGCQEPSDNNGVADVYVHDTVTNTTRRVSRGAAGADPDAASYDPAISGDGRYVAFVSEASNLTRESGRRRVAQIYLHDLETGKTELISRTPGGRSANGASLRPALSHDGSKIAFQSLANDLLCADKCPARQRDINLLWDVFLHDRATRRTIRMSTDEEDGWMENSRAPSLDCTGRVLAFGSWHPIDARDEGHDEDLYVWVGK